MDLENELRTALERMGSTAEEVAAALREKKVQGVRNAVRVLNPVGHQQVKPSSRA
jgi:hypothetical protein